MGLRRRLAVLVGAISWMPRCLPTITSVDLWIQRLSRGRFGVLDLAGLPHLTLVVPGRRTGIPRSTPLLCVPTETEWLIAGSNFGQPREPAWVHNLETAQRARVIWKGRDIEVDAVELADDDRERGWKKLTDTWPNFALYERRTKRRIRVWSLRRSS